MFTVEQTRQVVKETTLDEYKNDPWSGNTIAGQRRDKWLKHHLTSLYGETAWNDEKPLNITMEGLMLNNKVMATIGEWQLT